MAEGTLLQRATTLVACDPESPTTIWGWAIAEEVDAYLVLHFVYVRGGFQDVGIGTKLVGPSWGRRRAPSRSSTRTRRRPAASGPTRWPSGRR